MTLLERTRPDLAARLPHSEPRPLYPRFVRDERPEWVRRAQENRLPVQSTCPDGSLDPGHGRCA